MSDTINCPHETTLEDLRDTLRRVEGKVDILDLSMRGDGRSDVGVAGRLAAVEKQVREQADDRRAVKQTVVGGLVLAILTSIGAAALAMFGHGPN